MAKYDTSSSDLTALLLYGASVPEIGFCLDRLMADRGFTAEREGHYVKGATSITCQMIQAPCPACDFIGALNSPYVDGHRGSLASVVERHSSHVHISVTNPEGSKIDGLALLHDLARLVARAAMPSGLYWAPSNQLLTGAQYAALSGVDHPWALFLHPMPQGAGLDEVGRPKTALHLDDAAAFIGRPVRVAPSALPRGELLRLGLGFVQHCQSEGRIPPHGEVISAHRAERLEVIHRDGHVELVVHVRNRELPPPPRNTVRLEAKRPAKWRAALAASGIAAAVALSLTGSLNLMGPKTHAFKVAEVHVELLPPVN